MVEWLKDVLLTDFDVVGIATEGSSLLPKARLSRPDVIVLDRYMPDLDGFLACEQLLKENPAAKIVFLTVDEHLATANDALQRGASGYIVKKDAGEELPDCIRAVTSGRVYISRSALKGN